MRNIEIKARVPDLDALERRARDLGAAPAWTRRQRDVFFHVPTGYLKLRCVEGEPGELIAYHRAPGTEPRPSDYDIVPVGDPGLLERALTRSLGVRGVVAKTRRLWLWRHTRIHLDQVEGLGTFLELETVIDGVTPEAAEAEAREAIRALALDPDTFLDRPYLELLEASGTAPSSWRMKPITSA
jgi:adenylate cyclase class IV